MSIRMVTAALCALVACEPSTSGDNPDADVPGPDAPPAPWLEGFTYRKPIAVRYEGATALADFPLAIVRTADAQLAAHARPIGSDIVVTAGDGVTLLDTELATFDPGTGALELWVRLPSLPASAVTSVHLYYGGPPTARDGTKVWSSRFAGVWHLSDADVMAMDASGRGHHLTSPGTAARPMRVPGVVGYARAMDGLDDELAFPDPADGSLDFPTLSFAYSMWVREVAPQLEYDTPFYKGGTSASEPGYCFLLGTGFWEAKLHDGGNQYNALFGMETDFRDRWVHLVAVVDRTAGKLRTYVDGALTWETTMTAIGSLASNEQFRVGRANELFRGTIDEVRIYREALSADWIAAEHANAMTPGFLTVGPEETR